ncbi:MAG: potassium transporter Trk, partial [Candidatus Nitrosomaritimum yanchengensis]
MSTNPEKAISYILTKPVSQYMDKDVLLLNQNTLTRDAARMLQHYEADDIIVTDENRDPIG